MMIMDFSAPEVFVPSDYHLWRFYGTSYPVCGHARWVHPANPPQFTLQELQELVRTNAPESTIDDCM